MRRKISRRTLIAGLASVGVVTRPALAQAPPIRLGLLTVKTGPLAQGGIQMEQGLSVFLKQRNFTLAGRNPQHEFSLRAALGLHGPTHSKQCSRNHVR